MPGNRDSPSRSGSHDRDRGDTSSSHLHGHGHGHHHSRRHHSHSHRRRRFRLKHKERNFLAAVCSMIVIVTLCSAMAEPNWFYVRGGGCNVNTLGAYQFFYLGHFERPFLRNERLATVYVYSANPGDRLIDCVDGEAVDVMRGIIAMCFIGVALSLVAFFLDLSGPAARVLKIIRRNAIGNILTVLVCVTIHGFCYWETQLVEELQNKTKHHKGSKVEVKFDVSFYLIAAAGGMSVIATACNLLRRYPPYESESRENLLDDYDGMDIVSSQSNDAYSPMSVVPPPPAYSP